MSAPDTLNPTETLAALSRLTLSPLNPRSATGDIDALAASLRTVGLLQNLAGIEDPDGRIAIVAGGRRLRAFRQIAEEDGQNPDTVLVPVRLARSLAEAEAWAGTENLVRTALHPAEEIRAFATMAEGGAPETAIARAFAVTARHVRGRMKLAGLPAPILDALAADEITLDAAAANTLGSPERALEVFEALQGSWGADRPAEIRHQVLGAAQEAGSRLGLFVGRAAYEAAGGAITGDLFGEQVYFEDAELLARLAQAKLDEVAASEKAEGWKWVEVSFDGPDWQVLQKHARTYPEQADLSAEDATRCDTLAEAIEAGAASDAERAEFAALEAAQAAEIWTVRQKVFAGVFLHLDHRGEIRRGRADPRRRPQSRRSGGRLSPGSPPAGGAQGSLSGEAHGRSEAAAPGGGAGGASRKARPCA